MTDYEYIYQQARKAHYSGWDDAELRKCVDMLEGLSREQLFSLYSSRWMKDAKRLKDEITNWSITCPEWCTLSTKSGSGNATITVTAFKNDKTEQRTGQVIISGENVDDVNITITQEPADETPNEPTPGDNLPPS